MTRRFFFGPNTDEPILEDPGGSLACTNGTRFLHTNHQGSIVFTDTSGTAVPAPSYTLPGFPGQMKTLSDIHYNRYRDYDSSSHGIPV